MDPALKTRLRAFVMAIVWLQAATTIIAAELTPSFTAEQLSFYERKVRPILADNCFKCHSHEAEKIKGSLMLDSREGALRGGDTGPAIIPGDPEKSLLIKAVLHVDEDLKMPPKKQLSKAEIAVLEEWIKLGAPAPSLAERHGPRSTTLDTNWWAFQPVRAVKIPEVKDAGWARNPIDHFVFEQLAAKGLTPAPEAPRETLIRRVYFDLIGLPPTSEQIERFVTDNNPRAFEQIVDELLAKPAYGEKWARHWLDLVRFAESDGYKLDGFRPQAWRYRDYVIQSFNDDKPYNRFLEEQIAADELWPDDPKALAGLGYLRLPIYEYNQRNVKAQWASILNDITDVTSDAFLGLGLQCARCHDHKFDPILQKDYFRMQAFFAALMPKDDVPLATQEEIKRYRTELAVWEEKTAEVRAKIEALEKPVREKTTDGVIAKFPRDIQEIMDKPASERTPYEEQINYLAYRQVKDELDKLDGKFNGKQKQALDALKEELARFDKDRPAPLPEAMLAQDVGAFAPTITVPKDKTHTPVEPDLLHLLAAEPMIISTTPSAPDSTGRRAALANWLGDANNRFTSRVMVNRLWQRHFGQGLVTTLNDFGHLGEMPSHPALLDWLSKCFVEHDWSIKQMQRLIVTSATYRQSSTPPPALANAASTVDAGNRLLWRQNLRRLESDQIRDVMLWATGELDESRGGPSVDPSKPRRTIYTKWLRNSRDSLLDAFDPPDAYTSMPQRNITTTPMQSLVMINGPYVLQKSKAVATRIRKQCGQDQQPDALAATTYQLIYGRSPSGSEKARAVTFLTEQSNRIASAHSAAPVNTETMPKRSGTAASFRPGEGVSRMQVPDNPLMPQYDFTIEACVLLRSIEKDSQPRTIVSRWDGRPDQPGWSFGVAGGKASCAPRTLILELIGDPAEDGVGGAETIASGFQLELDTSYYVAVSVRIGDPSDTGITFFMKELTAGGGLSISHVAHKVTSNHQSNLPMVIGARDPEKHQIWDGLIDDVRLSSRALKAGELFIIRDAPNEGTVGFWRFEEPDFFKDSSPNGHNIRPDVSPTAQVDPQTSALIDLCHVLLNSSEFLYRE